METIIQDVREALRQFRVTPRLTLSALACITLGIGATVFIVTVVHGILLARPPFPHADRLVRLWITPAGTRLRQDLSVLDARDIQAGARTFDALEIAARTRLAVVTAEGTERMRGESVSPGYFDLIALRPALGRTFTPAEYAPNAPGVMLISDRMWRQKFGARTEVLGQTVRARGNTGHESDRLYTVVGVLPANFVGTVDTDISDFWLPIEQYAPRRILETRQARSSWVMARLRAGVTLAQARAEVAELGRRLAAQHPAAYRQLSLHVEPLGESWRARYRTGLLMLTGAAALLLLIACTNVANFVLARIAQREHEFRLRFILGARPARILRLLFVESLVLSAAGGLAGALLAVAGVRLFRALAVFQLPPYVSLTTDGRMLLLACGLVVLTALLFGTLPVALGLRLDDARRLREAGRGTTMGRRQRRLTDGLVAAQITFSFLLLCGSGLLLRTYANLVRADLGFRTDHVVRLAISLDAQSFPDDAAHIAFARAADAHLRTQPGVRDVAVMAGVLPPWFDYDVSL
ncbi:MAG: ABC transporter permease, partial [Longimicrobiales bacterium]